MYEYDIEVSVHRIDWSMKTRLSTSHSSRVLMVWSVRRETDRATARYVGNRLTFTLYLDWRILNSFILCLLPFVRSGYVSLSSSLELLIGLSIMKYQSQATTGPKLLKLSLSLDNFKRKLQSVNSKCSGKNNSNCFTEKV